MFQNALDEISKPKDEPKAKADSEEEEVKIEL